MKILAIGHKSRMGKDTLGRFIVSYLKLNTKNLKIGRISFASKLKERCYDLYKHLGLQPEEFYNESQNEHLRYVKLPKINKTPVEIWIEVGNKMREVYLDTWIDLALQRDLDIAIITDLRFPNEVSAVLSHNGTLIKLVNPQGPFLDSVSDRALDDFQGWHETVYNDASIKELHDKAVDLCTRYLL